MKIALLGGTFDPVHNAHIAIVKAVLGNPQYHIDKLWFMPNDRQNYYGLKSEKDALPFETRCEMLNLLHIPRTEVSTLERDHHLSGQTIELWEVLPKEHTYVFLTGSDQKFHKWQGWETLIHNMEFYVYERKGFPLDHLEKGMIPIHNGSPTDISSTVIRDMVRRKEPIDKLVPEEINKYIREHHLYEGSHNPKERR